MRATVLLRAAAALNAIGWLYLLVGAIADIRGPGVHAIIGAAEGLVVSAVVVVLSIASAFRPRRVLLWIQFIVSLLPAYFSGCELAKRLSQGGYVDMLRSSARLPIWLLFVALPFLWGACLWLYRRSRPNQSLEPTADRRIAKSEE
jgi:hypothetical protein